jgi:hypothetical protein
MKFKKGDLMRHTILLIIVLLAFLLVVISFFVFNKEAIANIADKFLR